MSATIQFDGYTLNDPDNEIWTERVQHRSLAKRSIDTMEVGREDGLAMIDAKFGSKFIPLRTTIHRANPDDLRTKLNEVQQNLYGIDKELIILDVDVNDTIVYKATLKAMTVTVVDPYTAILDYEFEVPKGRGNSQTESTNAFNSITVWQYSSSVTISGSYPAKPKITITFTTAGTCDSIQFTNTTTNKQIQIDKDTGDFADDDIIIIDCEEKTVTLNGTDYSFSGVFPLFNLGSNNFTINFFGNTAGIDQSQTDANTDYLLNNDSYKYAQSFQPGGTDTCPRIDLLISKVSGFPKYITASSSIGNDDTGNKWLCRTGDNRLHVLYTRGTGERQLYYRYSDDNSNSWSSEESVTTIIDDRVMRPIILPKSNDDVVIIWGDKQAGETYYNYHLIEGSTGSWSSESLITDDSTDHQAASAAIDSSDDVHLLYQKGGIGSTNGDLTYIKRTSSVWGSEETVVSANNIDDIQVDVDSSGYVHVVVLNNTNDSVEYYQRTTSWQSVVTMEDLTSYGGIFGKVVDIRCDSNNYIHVAWGKIVNAGADLELRYKLNNGSWQTTETVDTLTGVTGWGGVTVGLDRQNNIYVSIYSGWTIYVYRDDGASWTQIYTEYRYLGIGMSADGFRNYPRTSGVYDSAVDSGYFAVYHYSGVRMIAATDLKVEIQTDSAGDPSGTPVTNAEGWIKMENVSGSPTFVALNFSTPPSLTIGTTYHIVVNSEFLYTAFTYYTWRVNSADGYASGVFEKYLGASWADETGYDAAFKTYKGTAADQDADLDVDYYANYL